MSIITEATPNPNAMKFTSDKQIFKGDASVSIMPGETSEHDVLNDLLQIENVANVFGYQYFITVNKIPDVEWEELIPKIKSIISNHGY